LVRPGRVDRLVTIAPLQARDAMRMAARFYPDHPSVATTVGVALKGRIIPAAMLQGCLLETLDLADQNPEALCSAVQQALTAAFRD